MVTGSMLALVAAASSLAVAVQPLERRAQGIGGIIDRSPDPLETELAFGCGGVRYSLRYRQAFYAPAVRDTFGHSRTANLFSLIAGQQVVRGEGRSRTWRLFKDIVNIEGVMPACSAAGAEVTVRAMEKVAATGWTAGAGQKPPVRVWVIGLSPNGGADVRAPDAPPTPGSADRPREVKPSPVETELMFGCGGTRYSIRYREQVHAERFRRSFGNHTEASLLLLVAGSQVVRGPGRSRVWRLFDHIANIESVVPTCSAEGAEITVRAMDEIAAWSARGSDKPPVHSWVISMTPDAKADVRAEAGAKVY